MPVSYQYPVPPGEKCGLVECRVIDGYVMRERFTTPGFQVILQAEQEYGPFGTAVREHFACFSPVGVLKVHHDLAFLFNKIETDARTQPFAIVATNGPLDVFISNISSHSCRYGVAIE